MSPTSSPSPFGRTFVLLGGTIAVALCLAVGVAVGAVPQLGDKPSGAATGADSSGDAAAGAAPTPVPDPPAAVDSTAAVPAVDELAAETPAPEPTTGPAAPPPPVATPPITAEPTPSLPPTTVPALPPGHRLNPTFVQVQAAITQLHQRIPLFQPNESQLRTFADAVCASFDQGQTFGQVQATVQQAVSNVQGAALSAPDAEFAVRTVLELRCPGWLP